MINLDLYNISDEYINYLQEFEKKIRGFTKVSNNVDVMYNNKKPYVGIVLKINEFNYFVPLTHPKAHYLANKRFFDRLSFPINLKNGREYGRIMFCYMIPVLDNRYIQRVKINEITDEKYKSILMTQYFFINSREKSQIITLKAQQLYSKVMDKGHYLYKYCCDFKMLEEACEKRIVEEVK